MENSHSYIHYLYVFTKFSLYGFFIQCFIFTTLMAEESNAQAISIKNVPITINLSNKNVKDVFQLIEQESGYHFVFSANELNNTTLVSLQCNEKSIEEVLEEISKQTGLIFKQINKNISVKRGTTGIENTPPADPTVSGKVVETSGEPIPGANVIVKGTTIGTSTDAEGNYKLEVPPNSVLIFSFIGYVTQEITVESQTVINVELKADVASLQEVVVIGYGSVKKSDLTGSVATITDKELSKIPVASAAQALTGRLPGVNVSTSDGSPDADIVIRVRGGGSLTQDNSPLYVVDGFIVPSIRDIPPTDIESLTVLKDASSTAIYGAQAANGVIVVTTKKPKAGKTVISYGGFFQDKYLPKDRQYDVLSPYEYVMANYEYLKVSRTTAEVQKFEQLFGNYDDFDLYKNQKGTNWQDKLFGDPRPSQYHNLSISGGTDKTKIGLSLTNNKDQGLMLNSGYKRNVLNFKLDHQISKALTFEATARLTNTIVDGAGTTGNAQISIKDAVQTRPINGIADNIPFDPTQTSTDDAFQSFQLAFTSPTKLASQDWRKRTTTGYILNTAINWRVIDGLNLKSTFTSSNGYDENLRYYGPLTSESFNNGGNLPIGEKTNSSDFSYRWLNTASYVVKGLTNQDLDILLGQEIYSSGGKSTFIRGEDYRVTITPQELFANMQLGRADRFSTAQATESNRFSLFGRINYQLAGKYLATFTFREDASSKFAKSKRVGFFPAAALAWKLSEENFMKGVTAVNELKLRVSYGQTGNDRIDAAAFKSLLSPATNRGPGWGNVDNVYYTPSSTVLSNPGLVWETTTNRNAGLDFALFSRKVTGSIDVYYNTTKNLLLQSSIPSSTGYLTQWNNIGQTSNRGAEMSLTSYLIDKSAFSVSANFNIGLNRARIDALDGTKDRFFQSGWASTDLNNVNDYYLKVGGTIGDIYGYQTAGMYSVDDFESYNSVTGKYILKADVPNDGGVIGNSNLRPGFLKLVNQLTKDTDGDGVMDAADTVINASDRVVIGNALPKFQGGFGINVTYKAFDLSVFCNYTYGNQIYNAGKIQYNQYRRTTYANMTNMMNSSNRFTYLDDEGNVVTDLEQLRTMNEGKTMWSHNSFGVAGAVVHSWAIEDGSFIRLNNLTLGYTLPKSLISKVGMTSLRLYVTGNNLHLWTKYSGYDPEVSTQQVSASQAGSAARTNAALTPGVDYSAYPRSRSVTVGLNVSF